MHALTRLRVRGGGGRKRGGVRIVTPAEAQAVINRHYLPGTVPDGYTWHMDTTDPFAALEAVEGDALWFLFCPADGVDTLIVGYPPAKIVQMSLRGDAA